MKICSVSAWVSSALLLGGLAIAPVAKADTTTTTTTTTTVTGTTTGGGMAGGMDANKMITIQGVMGTWADGSDVPVVMGRVISSDILSGRTVIKTDYGDVSASSESGLPVLQNGKIVNWMFASPGQAVALPITALVVGPIPSKRLAMMTMATAAMGSGMGGDVTTGMGTGMGTGTGTP